MKTLNACMHVFVQFIICTHAPFTLRQGRFRVSPARLWARITPNKGNHKATIFHIHKQISFYPWRNNFACFMSLFFFVLSRCHLVLKTGPNRSIRPVELGIGAWSSLVFLKNLKFWKKWLKPENRRFNQINREPLRLNQLWASLAISKTHRNLKSQISNHKRWRWRSRSWEWKIKNKRRWRSWSWEQNIKNNMTWEESFRLHDERKWAEKGTLWD